MFQVTDGEHRRGGNGIFPLPESYPSFGAEAKSHNSLRAPGSNRVVWPLTIPVARKAGLYTLLSSSPGTAIENEMHFKMK
jgi:hypothetical protein